MTRLGPRWGRLYCYSGLLSALALWGVKRKNFTVHLNVKLVLQLLICNSKTDNFNP